MTDHLNFQDVWYLKLSNGQELVGQPVKVTKEHYTFSADIAVMFLNQSPDGSTGVNLSPWVPFTSDDEVMVLRSDVVMICTANADLTDFYKQATNKVSIVTPPKPTIII